MVNVMNRDRLVVLAALAAVVALAWGYLAYVVLARPLMVSEASATAALPAPVWDPGYFVAMLAMWVAMMLGMMLPSAAPTLLLFDTLQQRGEPARVGGRVRTALFAAGYVVAWGAFSIVATTLQWGLNAATLALALMPSTNSKLAGLLLVAAGAYQFTAWKTACLRQCRNPADFLVRHRRDGPLAPLLMGLKHGVHCIGCCWALMALLFAFGAINLLWAAALAILVLIEKLAPAGVLAGRMAAVLMVGAGAALLAIG